MNYLSDNHLDQILIEKIKVLETQISQKQREYSVLQSNAERKNRELKGEWQIIQKQHLETRKELTQLQSKYDNYLQQHDSHSNDIHDIKQKIQMLRGEISNLESEIIQLKNELKADKLNELEIKKKNEIIKRLQVQITDLERNLKSIQLSTLSQTRYSENVCNCTHHQNQEIVVPVYVPIVEKEVIRPISPPAQRYVVEEVITTSRAQVPQPKYCYQPVTYAQTCYYPVQCHQQQCHQQQHCCNY